MSEKKRSHKKKPEKPDEGDEAVPGKKSGGSKKAKAPKAEKVKRHEPKVVKETTEKVKEIITPTEFNAYAAELGQKYEEFAQVKSNRTAAIADFNSQTKEIEARVKELSRMVGTKVKEVTVTIQHVADYDAGLMRMRRKDTQEELKHKARPLEAAERQDALPLGERTGKMEQTGTGKAGMDFADILNDLNRDPAAPKYGSRDWVKAGMPDWGREVTETAKSLMTAKLAGVWKAEKRKQLTAEELAEVTKEISDAEAAERTAALRVAAGKAPAPATSPDGGKQPDGLHWVDSGNGITCANEDCLKAKDLHGGEFLLCPESND